jgi:1-acyl-sn-glycerol-3-phosphate acyltransferase
MSALPDPPSDDEIRAVGLLFEPWRRIVDPRYVGLDNIPSTGPMLLVGNHTIFGAQDLPLMMTDLHRELGLKVRPLGDRNHFRVPGWREFIERIGAVEGNRRNCAELLERGESVLVFPGGAREVNKRRGEQYELSWRQRLGFAHMAVAAGAPIVPFAALGGDENYDVVLDIGHPLLTPLRAALSRIGGDRALEVVPPVVRGIGPTVLPRLRRFYFGFAEPVATADLRGREDDQKVLRQVRDEVAHRIEAQLDELRALRGDTR